MKPGHAEDEALAEAVNRQGELLREMLQELRNVQEGVREFRQELEIRRIAAEVERAKRVLDNQREEPE